MNIQGYQKMTLLDYPTKVACTVFTGGCNLRCPFCHNAGLVLNPTEAENAESEVLVYLEKRKGIIDGVCITGGEPLLDSGLSEFIMKVKDMGYLVKLDTNGSLPERLEKIIQTGLVDYIAMDIKSSIAGYKKASGSNIPFEAFKKSIDLIKKSGIDHEFRTTAVKGIHQAEDFEEIAKLLKGEKKYFIQQFIDSGNLISDGCSPFSAEETAGILKAVQKYVPEATIRG